MANECVPTLAPAGQEVVQNNYAGSIQIAGINGMKKVMTAAFFALSMMSGSVLADAVIEVPKIAGKSKSEVASYLGKPTACGKSKYGEKCQYKKAETEIVYIKGKADWITIEAADMVPFSKEGLSALGLPVSKPAFSNDHSIRWNNVPGIMEISLFPAGSNTDYAYIKVSTR